MTVFTIGEVFNTIGVQPYVTRRIPSTHWGRMNSIISIASGAFSGVGNLLIGKLVDTSGFDSAWLVIGIAGIFLILCAAAMCITDKKYFPLLYEKSTPGGTSEAFSDSEPESSASGSDK